MVELASWIVMSFNLVRCRWHWVTYNFFYKVIKMKLSEARKRLKKARDAYYKELYEIAREVQKEYVVPYLDKNQKEMFVGNGTYCIATPGKSCDAEDTFPKRVLNALELETPRVCDDYLGVFMEDYNPSKN